MVSWITFHQKDVREDPAGFRMMEETIDGGRGRGEEEGEGEEGWGRREGELGGGGGGVII